MIDGDTGRDLITPTEMVRAKAGRVHVGVGGRFLARLFGAAQLIDIGAAGGTRYGEILFVHGKICSLKLPTARCR